MATGVQQERPALGRPTGEKNVAAKGELRGATHRVYAAVRALLARGAYPPGAHLGEEGLAADLGVSRTPVREAVRRLAAEGWLEIVPNQGAFVRVFNREDVEEVLNLRAMLEGFAARHAAMRATEGQIAEMREISEAALARLPCRDSEDADRVRDLNARFHRLIREASGQRRTATILANLVELPITSSYFQALAPSDMERSLREHVALVEAIAARDAIWTERLMEAHVHGGKSLFMERAAASADAASGRI